MNLIFFLQASKPQREKGSKQGVGVCGGHWEVRIVSENMEIGWEKEVDYFDPGVKCKRLLAVINGYQ